jgi:type III restriction enzyme
MLNLSYVITASIKFQNTLQNIIKGLQQSGFSEKDYREKDSMPEFVIEEVKQESLDNFLFPEQIEVIEEDLIDVQKINFNPNDTSQNTNTTVFEIEELAIAQNEAFQKTIDNQENINTIQQIYSEVGMKVKQYKMRESVSEQAQQIILPKFVIEVPQNDFLDMGQGETQLLDRVNLLKNFKLSNKDIDIPFKSITSDLYKIDTEKTSDEGYKMVSLKIDNVLRERITAYILAKPKESQIKDIAYQIIKQIDKMPPIADNEIKKYVNRILEEMTAEELQDFLQHKFSYTDLIKKKISDLADIEAEKVFIEWLAIDKITAKGIWKFEPAIIPSKTGNDIGNSLYIHEGDMNGLEEKFILEIANLSNIAFWHRNLGRGKGFSLNGFKSNHYPDFILVTKTNKVIVVETKGSDRDNSDSSAKLRLGKAWEKSTGSSKYKYLMVFDKNAIEGAYNLEEAIILVSKM